MTSPRTYRDDLLLALRLREVPGSRIADALAEVDSHLQESGEDPLEAFGPADAYAARLCEAIGLEPDETWTGDDTRLVLVYGLGAAVGAWLAIDGGLAWAARDTSLGLPPGITLGAGLLVLVLLGAAFRRLVRREADPVTDPRDGSDMVPPLPRWVVPAMVVPTLALVVILVTVRARYG